MRALGNGQPAKKKLLYQPPAPDADIMQETAAEETVQTEAPKRIGKPSCPANICLMSMKASRKS